MISRLLTIQFTIHDIRNIKKKYVCMYYEITVGHCYSKIAKFSLRCDYCCYITTLPTIFAFAGLHYFTFPTSVLMVRTMAILNVAKELYLPVITNKRSLSPPLSTPTPCVRARAEGDSVLFLDSVQTNALCLPPPLPPCTHARGEHALFGFCS